MTLPVQMETPPKRGEPEHCLAVRPPAAPVIVPAAQRARQILGWAMAVFGVALMAGGAVAALGAL